jgi:hypothetical protein
MSSPKRGKKIKFEGAGKYRIIVQGHIGDTWSDRLAGMRIESVDQGDDEPPNTILEGHLRDQAQLSGVLNGLYDLHLSILLVEYLEEENKA